jgi:hypothetical protein
VKFVKHRQRSCLLLLSSLTALWGGAGYVHGTFCVWHTYVLGLALLESSSRLDVNRGMVSSLLAAPSGAISSDHYEDSGHIVCGTVCLVHSLVGTCGT